MDRFSRHITSLLYAYDCVILPGLGGFVKHRQSAYYDENNGTFMPPCDAIGFNSQLKLNDGLLIQSYMKQEAISFENAKQQVEHCIQEIVQSIESTGSCTLTGIGTLYQEDGIVKFDNISSNNFSLEYYGFCKFPQTKFMGKAMPQEKDRSSKHRIFSLTPQVRGNRFSQKESRGKFSMSLSRSVIIVATIIGFIFFTNNRIELVKSHDAFQQNATLMGGFVFGNQKFAIEQNVQKDDKKNESEILEKEPEESNIQKSSVALQHKQEYTIVLASAITKKNASLYIDELRAEGFDKACFYEKNGMKRVIYSSYETEDEARNALNALRTKGKIFSDAWILHIGA